MKKMKNERQSFKTLEQVEENAFMNSTWGNKMPFLNQGIIMFQGFIAFTNYEEKEMINIDIDF